MAKSDLLKEAKALGLDVTDDNTVAEIEAAIAAARDENDNGEEVVAEKPTKLKTNERGQPLCPVCGRVGSNHVHRESVTA